jgi:tetratricopeptide (TPR) repeat protein
MTQSQPPSAPSRGVRVRQRVGKWLLAATVLASALMLGSLITWTLCLITALLAASVFLLWFGAEGSRARPVAGVLVAVGLLLTAFTALQCVPLPASWLAAIAPENADIWARALRPLHEPGPAYAPLSLEPVATHIQVLRGVAYLLAFVGALRVAQRREGMAFLQNVLVACGAILAVAALIHPAFGAEKVFWIYQPAHGVNIATRHIAPLLNSNHLAAYVNIATCVALASAIAPRPTISRPIVFALFLMLVGVQVWIGSRAGAIGTLVGILVVVVMTRAARRGVPSRASSALVLAVVGAAAFLSIVLASSDAAWSELADTDLSKLDLAKEGLSLTRLFPWLGSGRGAFESVFPAVRSIAGGYIMYAHPENLLAQWATEWGAPLAVLGLTGIAFALRPASVMARTEPPVGAWAAIVAVALHDLVDFSLEVPGIVIPLALCAAIITGGSAAGGTRSILSQWSTRANATAVAGAICAATAILWVLPGRAHELGDERFALRDRALDPATDTRAFDDALRGAMLRHPAEPYFPFLGALHAAAAKDESVMPWIERTLERAPVYGPAHLLLARSLYTRSPSQARLEYRIALEQDASMLPYFRLEAPHLVRGYDDAMELVPARSVRSGALYVLIEQLSSRLPATCVRLDEELAKAAPDLVDPLRRKAEVALSDLREEAAAPWCASDRRACVAGALAAAVALKEKRSDQCSGYVAHARVLIADGQIAAGLDELEDASTRAQDWGNCLHALIDAAREVHDDARITAALDRLVRAGCRTDDECVANLNYAAGVEIERGNPRRAVGLYKKAYELLPNDELLISKAALAARTGLHAEALDDYTLLAQKHPEDNHWSALERAERDALARSVVMP